jgi:flagellar biosynthetic protein FliR
MSLFDFNQEELLTFFAVLIRFSVMIAVMPITGDRFVPALVKVLLSLAVSIALFPALIARGEIHPAEAGIWGNSVGSLAAVIGFEALFALVVSFVARMAFESVSFGGNLIGSFMGFSMASTYDPHQESQTQVVGEIQMAIAVLTFLVIDGHHLMLRAAFESYRIVGLGGLALLSNAGFNGAFSQKLIELSGQVVKLGVQLGAPVALVLFGVNVVFGVMAKAMPQLNILVLSFAASALIGLCVLFLATPELQQATGGIVGRMGEWMTGAMVAMATGK